MIDMHVCKYCGLPTDVDPADQSAPVDYCDHAGSKASALACGAAFLLFSGFATAGPFFPAWDRINPNQSAMPIQDFYHIGPIGSVGPKVKPRSEAPGCPLYDDSGVVVGWSLGCQIPEAGLGRRDQQ